MSSRSLAAARSRRAGENAPPVSGNRPGTSIGSQSAFSQQMPQGYQTNIPQPPSNVRTSKGQQQQNINQKQQQKQEQNMNSNGLPFNKLSISDAIGLITLRLGRVEKWIIETDHDNEINENNHSNNLPENSRIVDNSVLSTIISRLDSVEKKESSDINNEDISKLSSDITKLTEQLTRVGDEGTKHTLAIAKHAEQLFRFERELVETKDILKTFMIKYDLFSSETNNRFTDFEYALSDLEKIIQPIETDETNVEKEKEEEESVEQANEDNTDNSNVIMSVDLKNIIKQELASSIS
jgi:hypothetical protein